MNNQQEQQQKKAPVKRVRRTDAQVIKDMELKLAATKAKVARKASTEARKELLAAAKDGRIEEGKVKEFSILLRYLYVMERAPEVFEHFGKRAEAGVAATIRDMIIETLEAIAAECGSDGDGDSEVSSEDDEVEDDDEEDVEDDEEEDDEDEG